MGDTTADIDRLIGRLKGRDPAAPRELIARAHARLRKLAAKMLRESFPGVAAVSEVDSVVGEAYQPLAKALEGVELPTPADFFRFAAYKVRQTLLDMAAGLKRRPPAPPESSGGTPFEPADPGRGADARAMWAELHERVAEMPDEVRAVFEPCHYLGLSQAEVAAALGAHPREVSRLWHRAIVLLRKYVPDGA